MNDHPLEQLVALEPGGGQVALSWFGQASFAARGAGATALFDPFLSPYPGRLHDSPLAASDATGVDVVFCSHEHVDHFDADAVRGIAAASRDAVFVLPSPIVDMATEAGVAADRVIGLQPGETTDVAGLSVRAVPACHGVTMDDAYGFGESLSDGLVRFLGFVVAFGSISVYHAGDTIHFAGMEETLAPLGIDVALLPINGRDAEREGRGIVGNLDHREAAWLASQTGAGVLVPMHYDLFAGNLGFPGALVETVGREYPDVPVLVPARARPFLCSADGEPTMKALVYLGPGQMELQDAPEPEPAAGEVVIASRKSAICGSDLHGFREASPRRIPPLIMGHETVGEIAAVGDGVSADRVGERVVLKPIVACGACDACHAGDINHCATGRLVGRDLTGGFAERFAVPERAVVAIPDGLDDGLAVLTEPLANAVHVTSRSVRAGDRVFVIGAGPIGVLMARSSILAGASRVLITDPVADRLRRAEAQGAEPVPGEDPAAAVVEATGGTGADLVIDAAGYEATWALGIHAVRTGGKIYEVGLGSPSGVVDYFAVLGKEVTITGSYAWGDQDFARAIELLADDALDATGWITTMPFGDGQRAFEDLTGGGDSFKVVLVPLAPRADDAVQQVLPRRVELGIPAHAAQLLGQLVRLPEALHDREGAAVPQPPAVREHRPVVHRLARVRTPRPGQVVHQEERAGRLQP